ncbi:PGF-CTERM sorting domain-containing protein [Halorarius litoreus]|uniref:PGF-CTERM sorting domain-containing protein n=1 Tax=Halorarius litoreus TaxID=2962676 RepID=UPI0020CD154E|nr:PGF-CTERM sorting domain-containing protein [Halorarius litoreus]
MSWASRLTATALALLLVLAAATGGVAASPLLQEESDDDDGLPEAEDAYVTEEGDVVLMYQNDSEGSQTEFGIDVSESVLHALVVTNATETDATGQATAVIDPDGMTANGSLVAPTPASITSMTLDATAEQTDENAAFDASLQATLNDSNTAATGIITGAEASGSVEVAPDTFTASGQFNANLRSALGDSQHQQFSVRETENGYTLDGSQNYTLSSFAQDRWSTRARAEQSLEAQYSSLAQSLGGSSDVTLESYAYTETSSGARLDIAFTVEYTGIDEGVQQQISASLVNSEQYNLTEAEAQEVADSVAELHVDEVSLRFDQTPESVSGEFTARLSEYDGAIRAAMTVASSVDTEENVQLATQLDRVEKTLDARQESGLIETFTFDVTVDSPSSSPTTVEASVDYRTENWAAYRDALDARGIDTANAEYELHAETQGEEVVVDATASIQQEDLLQRTSNTLLNSTNASDTETRRFIRAFQDAKLRKAKVDVDLTEQELRIEAGAAFEDLTSLREAIRASTDSNLKIASIVGRTEGEQVNTYVRLDGAVSADATEADVRALGPVGANTTVHLAGTYNQTFPELDVDGAYEYLGIPQDPAAGGAGSQSGSGSSGTDGAGPGFGIGLAAVAMLGAALLLARRDE